MNDIESRIHRGINQMAPDVFQNVLADKGPRLESETWLLDMQPAEKRNMWMRAARTAALLAACVALVFGLGVYQMILKVDSVVEIDVNPSLELLVNRSDRVVRLNALNADGVKILDSLEDDLKSEKLEDAVCILVDEMVSDGYLDQDSCSVLVSVSHGNEARSEELQLMVADNVKETLAQDEIKGIVYHQSYEANDSISELAVKYNISPGKASFIQKLILKRPDFSIEELARLSISEITRLLEEESVDVSEYTAEKAKSKKVKEKREDSQDTSEDTLLALKETENPDFRRESVPIKPGQVFTGQEDSLTKEPAAESAQPLDGENTNVVADDMAGQGTGTGQTGTSQETPGSLPSQDNSGSVPMDPEGEAPDTSGDEVQDGTGQVPPVEEETGGSAGMESGSGAGNALQWEDVTGIPEPLYTELKNLISVTEELLANISNMEPLETAGGYAYAYETCRSLLAKGSSQHSTVYCLVSDMHTKGSLTEECYYRADSVLKTAEAKQKAASDFLELYAKSKGVLQ